MSYLFTAFARAHVAAFSGATLKMALFQQAPAFAQGDTRYTDVQTVADLRSRLGWVEANVAGYPNDTERALGTRTSSDGKSVWMMMSELALDPDMAPVRVRAVAFYLKGVVAGVTNPVVLITNTPVGSGLVLTGGDRIAPLPDTTVGSANNQWVIGWAVSNPGNSLVEGPLATQKNAPDFEPSHVQHVWMYPQRTNFIANPSFEGGIGHWRTNGTASQITDPMLGKIGRFDGPGPTIVESNRFPALSPHFTVQLMAKTAGNLKVGLITWPVEYNETNIDWGGEEWAPSATDFVTVQGLRAAPQPYECMLRIETDAPRLELNNVLVENDFLLDWPYFDGDTTHSARDDFSWYGGENLKGQTYSIWYNNKRATAGRLFATAFPDRASMTSDDELAEGLSYRWVPAGVIVEPHWDVLYPYDLRHPIPNVAGTPVTPYKTAPPGTAAWAADMGVSSPWV